MSQSPATWLALLDTIADIADEIAMRHFRSSTLQIEVKGDQSPVTEADRAIEEAARGVIGRDHPDVGVFGEEQGDTSGQAPIRLIIDPIDSTRNFMRGIPIFASLLAIEVEGEIAAGVVSAPALSVRWRAARGVGAFRMTDPIRVSTIDRLSRAQVFHPGLGGTEEVAPPDTIHDLLAPAARTRGFGDFYQHVLVAEGAGEIGIDPIVQPWDVAPLLVIVEEAGGRATTMTGERSIYGGSLVTSNTHLHDTALDALRVPRVLARRPSVDPRADRIEELT